MIRILFGLLLLPFLCEAHGDHDHEHCEEAFHWTEEKSAAANILAREAGPGMIQHIVQVSGKVALHPDHLAYVIPKVEGTVKAIYKNVGDRVEAGEAIALVESKEIAAAKAGYLTAEKKSRLQLALLQREASLRKISAGQDYWNAELAAQEASIHAAVALQHLYALGLSPQEVERLAGEDQEQLRYYQVRSPIAGKIIHRDLTLGESLEPSLKIFTVANFDQLWVEIHIGAHDAHYLKEGLPVEIATSDQKKARAVVSYFNPTICEETRKATAVALLENSEQRWAPGEYITAYVQTEQASVSVAVPREAVQLIKGEACVFVEDPETGYAPCAVKLGKMDAVNVEIVSGLKSGIRYAACNTFCLKADYEKSEAEHHH